MNYKNSKDNWMASQSAWVTEGKRQRWQHGMLSSQSDCKESLAIREFCSCLFTSDSYWAMFFFLPIFCKSLPVMLKAFGHEQLWSNHGWRFVRTRYWGSQAIKLKACVTVYWQLWVCHYYWYILRKSQELLGRNELLWRAIAKRGRRAMHAGYYRTHRVAGEEKGHTCWLAHGYHRAEGKWTWHVCWLCGRCRGAEGEDKEQDGRLSHSRLYSGTSHVLASSI